jgi:hypothetical protein
LPEPEACGREHARIVRHPNCTTEDWRLAPKAIANDTAPRNDGRVPPDSGNHCGVYSESINVLPLSRDAVLDVSPSVRGAGRLLWRVRRHSRAIQPETDGAL